MPPSSSRWDESQMPSQRGRLVIVTGANAGLGLATSLGFARSGAHVVLACRNEARGLEAQKQINEQLQTLDATDNGAVGEAEYMQLDVGVLQSVRDFASAFKKRFLGRRLDILVLNAGVKAVNYGETVDGFEQQFGVNHLGHFALAALLFPVMKMDVGENAGVPPARIVSISSISHHGSSLDMKQLSAKPENYDAMGAYRASKLANLLFANELHRRLEKAGISPKEVLSVVCHPGVTESNLLPNLASTYNSVIIKAIIGFVHWLPWAQTNAQGALNILCCATDPNVVGGEFIGPHGLSEFYGWPRTVASSKQSMSLDDARELWEESEKLTGISFNVEE
ncbi:WW domain-containing oxidoreductase [Phytophthora citrophthora]|uniref:WW domain-containing oxidoreductase n=1 Tax=Phytophthora citrophthora TaxID=4793 RepID=A0AAD9LFN1_9STRA|nr:WW domain-containing oxidoreductase [Phytophthora citrophthora]